MEKRLAGGLHNGKNKQTNRRETAVNEAVNEAENEAATRRFLPVSLLSPSCSPVPPSPGREETLNTLCSSSFHRLAFTSGVLGLVV